MTFFAANINPGTLFTKQVPNGRLLHITGACLTDPLGGKATLSLSFEDKFFPICHLSSEGEANLKLQFLFEQEEEIAAKVEGTCGICIVGYEESLPLDMSDDVSDDESEDQSEAEEEQPPKSLKPPSGKKISTLSDLYALGDAEDDDDSDVEDDSYDSANEDISSDVSDSEIASEEEDEMESEESETLSGPPMKGLVTKPQFPKKQKPSLPQAQPTRKADQAKKVEKQEERKKPEKKSGHKEEKKDVKSEKKEGDAKCPECGKVFGTTQALNQHKLQKHGNQPSGAQKSEAKVVKGKAPPAESIKAGKKQ